MLAFASVSGNVAIPKFGMENRIMLTQQRAKHLYSYDPLTGHLQYKVRLSPKVKVGDVVGGTAKRYRYVTVDGKAKPLHHLVWFWHTGEWPAADLSFRDGNPGNTHIENLVPQSKSETVAKHKGLRASNTTGVKGVSLTKSGKYQAHIYGPGGSRALGRHFKTLEDAAIAIEKAKAEGLELRSTPPEKKALSNAGYEARKIWRHLNFVTGTNHAWDTPLELFSEVGFAPSRKHQLAAVDTNKPLGPGNTCWSETVYARSTVPPKLAQTNEQKLNKKLFEKFGITLEEYKAKLVAQKGLCAVCEEPETALSYRNNPRSLVVDHDHETQAVRGLLCRNCNVALGYFKDNPKIIRSAAAYLEKWKATESAPLPDNVVPLKKA